MTDPSTAPGVGGPSPEPSAGPHQELPAARELIQRTDEKTGPNLKRAIPATVVAVLAFIVGSGLNGGGPSTPGSLRLFGWYVMLPAGWVTFAELLVGFIFVLAGVIAARAAANELQRVSASRAGAAAGSAIRLICMIVAMVTIVVGAFAILNLDLGNLLVGGAVTGIVLGIAAQQTLNNFFAGLVLFFARPYVSGQRVKIRSGSMGGPFVGVIVGAGMMYTLIDTDDEGLISMPNAGLMLAAIGPAPDVDPDTPPVCDPDPEERDRGAAELAGS